MRIVIAGGHGQVGLRLGALIAGGAHTVVGLVRGVSQITDLRAVGVTPIVLDLEDSTLDEVAGVLTGADAVVFAAGAGPGSGAARKDAVDRAAAVLLADACERAGVPRYLLVSSMGVEQVRDGAAPEGVDEVFAAYLRAKLAAEDDLRARDLEWTVLRPGRLTDQAGTGRVRLAERVERGDVPRDDVAAVLAALLDAPGTAGAVLELVSGDTPVADAVASLADSGRHGS
jgi:nucleoside-diphosphate-sugar epimerase